MKEVNINTGIYDNKVVILNDQDNLTIKVKGKMFQNLTYLVKAKIGEKSYTKKIVDNLVEFKRDELNYGILECKIVAIADENEVKEYKIENLILKEVNSEMLAIPELEGIKQEFNQLINENKNLKKEVEELRILCENTKDLVVQLNGLSEKVGA